MPFTLSHPAAAVPFWPLVRRRLLPLSPLVIGTMSPDFEFLRALRTDWNAGHTLAGLFYLCLPGGLLMTLLWVALLRDPLRDLVTLPAERLRTTPRWWAGAVVALLLGAVTHQLWDGLTHADTWATAILPVLDRSVLSIHGAPVPLANVLQHLSTVLGGIVVVTWLVRTIASGVPRDLMRPWRLAAWAGILAVSLALAAWKAPPRFGRGDFWLLQGQVSEIAVGALVGLLAGLTGFALIHRVVASRRPRPSAVMERRP